MNDTPVFDRNGIVLYCGDCREIAPLLATDSIDLVLTDPPYDDAHNWVWPWLGETAARVLKPGGSLVTLCGVHQLPVALDGLRPALRYWWTGGMLHTTFRRTMGKGVVGRWKPALWFVKERRRQDVGGSYPVDMLQGASVPGKTRHHWEQPLDWFRHWQDRLTIEGDIVFDPFAGSGSVLVGARMSNRRAVGIEMDERHAQRLSGELEMTGHVLRLPYEAMVDGILPE